MLPLPSILPATEQEQILFLDNFYSYVNLEDALPVGIENWLTNIVQKSTNSYSLRASMRILRDLSLIGKLSNIYIVKGLIQHHLDNSSDPLVVSFCINVLSTLEDSPSESVIEKLKHLSNHVNSDISLAGLTALGEYTLSKAVVTNGGPLKLLAVLSEAEKYFDEASHIAENSTDAHILNGLVKIVTAAVSNDPDLATSSLVSIKNYFIIKEMYEHEAKYIELTHIIWTATENLSGMINSLGNVSSWLNFSLELRQLLRLYNNLSICKKSSASPDIVFARIYSSIIDESLNTLYGASLADHSKRIDALLETSDDSRIIGFLHNIKEILPRQNTVTDLPLLAKLVSEYGETKGQELYHEVKDDPIKMVTALANLASLRRESFSRYIGGSRITEEVFLNLKQQIEKLLPDYPSVKSEIFDAVLSEIIRYSYRSIAGSSKKDFLYLYAESENGKGKQALERDIQDHLYEFLSRTRIAYGFEHEKSKFVDGGRVDIVFKTDAITLPIELKKTFATPTIPLIEQNYIAQAQTYTTVHDQLGIFVLLDLSGHPTDVPMDFRDRFHIHSITPDTVIPQLHPDYIVSIIIQGNKVTPSAKSTYR